MQPDRNGRNHLTPMTCATCGREFFLQHSPTPPFCSERCQLIDLGHWLDESIALPHEGDSGDVPRQYRDEDPADSSDEDED